MCVISIRAFSSSFTSRFFTNSEFLASSSYFGENEFFVNNTFCAMFDSILWIRTGVYAIIVLVLFILAKTPIRNLRRLLFVPVMGLLLTFFRMIAWQPNNNDFPITLDLLQLPDGLLYTLRFLVTATSALILFETTSRLQMLEALEQVEDLLKKIFPPLKKFHVARIVSIAIGFIPEIFTVWNQVNLAARARMQTTTSLRSATDSWSVAGTRSTANSQSATGKQKISIKRRIAILVAEFSALLSCMMQRAEETRKAVENRS